MNLRGTHQDLYQENLKAVVPMLVSTNGYGILLDCYSLTTFHDDEQGSLRFPKPQAMAEELHRLQARLMVSIWPTMNNQRQSLIMLFDFFIRPVSASEWLL